MGVNRTKLRIEPEGTIVDFNYAMFAEQVTKPKKTNLHGFEGAIPFGGLATASRTNGLVSLLFPAGHQSLQEQEQFMRCLTRKKQWLIIPEDHKIVQTDNAERPGPAAAGVQRRWPRPRHRGRPRCRKAGPIPRFSGRLWRADSAGPYS